MVALKFAAFPNPVGFCFVAIEMRAGGGGRCVHVRAGRGAVAEALAMDVKGVGPVEDGHHGSVSEGPAHFEGTVSRELLTSHGKHLGNRLPLWICSAPLAFIQPFSGTSGKPWPPPRARAAEL